MAYCTHLEWAEEPHITPCAAGEPADFRGLKIFAVYSNGEKIPVDVIMKMFHETNLQETGTERQAQIVYEKKKLSVSIPLKDTELQRIEAVPAFASALTFREGETFNRSCAVVTAYYSDGTSREIDSYKIFPHLPLTLNDQSITFRYGRCTCELPLTVLSQNIASSSLEKEDVSADTQADGDIHILPDNPPASSFAASEPAPALTPAPVVPTKTVVAVSVAKKPNRQKYLAGDTLVDLKGGRLDIIYSDGTAGQIDMIADGPIYIDSAKPGTGSISFTCLGASVSFPIDVLEPQIVKLSISVTFRYHGREVSAPVTVQPLQVTLLDWVRQPAKTVYYTHEKLLSCDGGVLRILRNNGTEEEVPLTAEMVSGFRTDRAGPLPLRVSCAGRVIPFSITVQERTLLGLRVVRKPRLEYTEGEEFDPEGLVVEAVYSGETAETVGVTYLPYGPLGSDTSSVMLVYQDKAVVIPITVSKSKSLEHHPIIPVHLPTEESLSVSNPQPISESVPDPMPALIPVPSGTILPEKGPGEMFELQGDSTEDPFVETEEEKDILAGEKSGTAPSQELQKKGRKRSVPAFYPSSFGRRVNLI